MALDAKLFYGISLEAYSSEIKNISLVDYYEVYWIQAEAPPPLLPKEATLPKGDSMYLVPPFRRFNINLEGKAGLFLAFHRSLLDLEVREYSLDVFRLFGHQGDFRHLFIKQQELPTLEVLSSLLIKESGKKDKNFLFLKNLLKTFIIKLISLKNQKQTVPDLNEKRIYQFFLLVENHYLTERKASFYAEQLNITPKRLNQILKEKLNKTITQILHERLIKEAKHELFISDKSIMEIGIKLGFSDKSYFSRFFKKMTGVSPEGYKAQIKEKIHK